MSRELAARVAAHQSWANTPDRRARTANARRNGPSELQWHLDRLPASFANVNEAARLVAAESARAAYFGRLALKSAISRKRGAA